MMASQVLGAVLRIEKCQVPKMKAVVLVRSIFIDPVSSLRFIRWH